MLLPMVIQAETMKQAVIEQIIGYGQILVMKYLYYAQFGY